MFFLTKILLQVDLFNNSFSICGSQSSVSKEPEHRPEEQKVSQELLWSIVLHYDTMNVAWIPLNLLFHYILFHEKRLQTMLWHHNTRVNSHQRWKQTQFHVCFHPWCELTTTMNVTEWQLSWNSCYAWVLFSTSYGKNS